MKSANSKEMVAVSSSGTIFPRRDTPAISFYDHQTQAMACLDRINKLQRFDCLVAQAAGQDMNNYEMPEYDAKNVDYSQDLVDAIGRDLEDIVRANPDAYGPQ